MPETLMQWAAVGQLPQFHADTINARESMHRVKVKIVCTAVQQIINALFHFKGNAVNYFKARPHIRHAGGGL